MHRARSVSVFAVIALSGVLVWRSVSGAGNEPAAREPTRGEPARIGAAPDGNRPAPVRPSADQPRQSREAIEGPIGENAPAEHYRGQVPMSKEPELAGLRDVRVVMQTINRTLYKWTEYEIETSDGRRFVAIEQLLPVRKRLSPLEASALLRASQTVQRIEPKPGSGLAIPASEMPDAKAVEPYYVPDKKTPLRDIRPGVSESPTGGSERPEQPRRED